MKERCNLKYGVVIGWFQTNARWAEKQLNSTDLLIIYNVCVISKKKKWQQQKKQKNVKNIYYNG